MAEHICICRFYCRYIAIHKPTEKQNPTNSGNIFLLASVWGMQYIIYRFIFTRTYTYIPRSIYHTIIHLSHIHKIRHSRPKSLQIYFKSTLKSAISRESPADLVVFISVLDGLHRHSGRAWWWFQGIAGAHGHAGVRPATHGADLADPAGTVGLLHQKCGKHHENPNKIHVKIWIIIIDQCLEGITE